MSGRKRLGSEGRWKGDRKGRCLHDGITSSTLSHLFASVSAALASEGQVGLLLCWKQVSIRVSLNSRGEWLLGGLEPELQFKSCAETLQSEHDQREELLDWWIDPLVAKTVLNSSLLPFPRLRIDGTRG